MAEMGQDTARREAEKVQRSKPLEPVKWKPKPTTTKGEKSETPLAPRLFSPEDEAKMRAVYPEADDDFFIRHEFGEPDRHNPHPNIIPGYLDPFTGVFVPPRPRR
jgi:hypothetical protein